MGLTYFKRYRMEINLTGRALVEPELPEDYSFVSWRERLLETHADTKYRSFQYELDSHVFPSLGHIDGCLRLMREISERDGFLGVATWLLKYQPPGEPPDYCGTIQGLRSRREKGAIQNVGITPEHRGNGLGTCLVNKCLRGFRNAGIRRISLQVTAKNTDALRLYRRLGFRKMRTVYRTSEVANS